MVNVYGLVEHPNLPGQKLDLESKVQAEGNAL